MAFVCIRSVFVSLLAALILTPHLVRSCSGCEENVWTDGVWEILALEESGSQSRISASITVEDLESGATLEIWQNDAWVSGGLDTYTTSSVRVSGGTATLKIAYASCEEDVVLGDD